MSKEFQKLYTAFIPHMRRLYDLAKVQCDGRALLRPCSSTHYNGLWHDDFTWPLIAMPELQKEQELRDVIPWISEAVLDLPVVPDRVEFEGTVVMSPGWTLKPPMSSQMPLHLPSAWVRLLSYAESSGVSIPDKDRWANLIQRSFDEVPFSFGLVFSDTQREVVGFGFHDSIRLAGLDLMTSLVTLRGLERACSLFANEVKEEVVANWRRLGKSIRENIYRLFDEEIGGFVGASKCGRAFSVWGNGLAWPFATDEQKCVIADTLRTKIDQIFHMGCTRQVPGPGGWPGTNRDVRYQNGGYWGTGTGFVLPMLAEIDESWALDLAKELLNNLEAIQYSEWIDQEGTPFEPLEFLGTTAMPMVGLRAIIEGKNLLEFM